MSQVLVTGIAGFIGHHFAQHLLETTDWEITGLVSFRHRGDSQRLPRSNRVRIFYHDLNGPISPRLTEAIGQIDYAVNLAADSHVDRSIIEPGPCITNNVNLIINVLEWARVAKPRILIQVSTDEVYGPANQGPGHREWAPIFPSNPYAASKAAQEAIAMAYLRTYGVPVVITNAMNTFGERQDPEKFVPLVMQRVQAGAAVAIHADFGLPGSRFWMHARNHADALLFLLQRDYALHAVLSQGYVPRYNVVGDTEVDNLAMAKLIASFLKRPLTYELVPADRPGHDFRYALDGSKLAGLGWRPPLAFLDALQHTVDWTAAHPEWLRG